MRLRDLLDREHLRERGRSNGFQELLKRHVEMGESRIEFRFHLKLGFEASQP